MLHKTLPPPCQSPLWSCSKARHHWLSQSNFAVMFFLSFSGEASLTCAGLQQQMVEEGEEDLSVLPAAAKNWDVLGKLLPAALSVIKIGRGTKTWPNTISCLVLSKRSPIVYLKGTITGVNKVVFCCCCWWFFLFQCICYWRKEGPGKNEYELIKQQT